MYFYFTFFIALFFSFTAFAQNDPFAAVNTSLDAAALSPSELPDFESYRKSPENISIITITPKELVNAQAASRERIILLDARKEVAYNISHIKEAKRCGFDDFSVERVWMLKRKARIVVYSNTENHSLLVAQYLRLMGFYDIQILKGGIIEWKNDGFEVVDLTSLTTDKVHVGPKENMRLLKHGRGFHD